VRKKIIILFMVMLLSFASKVYPSSLDHVKPSEIKKLYQFSVVAIQAEFERKVNDEITIVNISQGTGFFVTDKLLLTNNHVVQKQNSSLKSLQIIFERNDGILNQTYKVAGSVEKCINEKDLAILSIENDGSAFLKNIKPLPLNQSPNVDINVYVYALGYSMKDHKPISTVSFGKISSQKLIFNSAAADYIESYILDIPVAYGNSGSPLLDSEGSVIGVLWGAMEGQRKGVAMCGSVFYNFVQQYIKAEKPKI
jgi:S1-C subfamily serine protease